MNLDLELNLADLWGAAQTQVTSAPPQCSLDLVIDEDDPSKGYLTLEVRGFSVEDAKPLRRAYNGACEAYNAVSAYARKRLQELNPRNDPAGVDFAEATVLSEVGEYRGEAARRLTAAARNVCFLGVVGYPAGALKHRGVDVPYATEDRELLGKKRSGLASLPLALLETGGLTIRLARQLLDISAGESPTTKEEQWKQPAAKEAPQGDAPLADTTGPAETLEASPEVPGSASHSG